MKKILFNASLMLAMLSGCTMLPQPRIIYPADLLVRCGPLTAPAITYYDDVLDYIEYSVGKYDDCGIRHNALVDIIMKDKAVSQ